MFFTEDHLRVTKVRTMDGMTPVFNEVTGKPETKIVFAPNTKETRRLFDELNSRLPNHLKMKIEQVKGYKPQPAGEQPTVDVTAMQKELEELKALNKTLLENQEQKKPVVKGVKSNAVTENV